MRSVWPFVLILLRQRLWLLLGMGLALLTLVAGIGLLSLSGWFISAAAYAGLVSGAATFNYFLPSAGVRFFALLRIVCRYGDRVVNHDLTFKLLADLRVWFYDKLIPLAPGVVQRQRQADLLNRMVSDIDALDNLYVRVLTPFLMALLVAVIMLGVLHFFNITIAWWVFGMLLASIIVIPLLSAVLSKKAGGALAEQLKALRVTVVESVQNVTEIRLFALLPQYQTRVLQEHNDLLKAQRQLAIVRGLANALVVLMSGFTLWLALYIGVGAVNHHVLNGANLALIALGILAAYEAVMPLPMAFNYLGQTVASAKRVNDLAHQSAPVKFPEQSQQVPADSSVTFDAVSFRYERDLPWVCQALDMQVAAGEKVAIVGPTGVGKSTLLQLLTRSVVAQEGAVLIGGCEVAQLSEADLRQQMTILPQRPHLFSESLRENLLIANPHASEVALWSALETVQLKEFVQSLPEGLETWVGEAGTQFSGGQIRRLALARAILHDAPIWLLDEPTEGLDYRTENQLLDTIMQAAQNKTVLLVTHRLAGVALMDRVIKLGENCGKVQ